MSARPSPRKFGMAAVWMLTAVAAFTLAAPTAFAGKPVFQRSKPHVNVGSGSPSGLVAPRPQPPTVRLGFRPTMIFSQPHSAASSGAEYKYVPVRRTSGSAAMETLELAHEGFFGPIHGGTSQIRFGDGRHGAAAGSLAPGGHVKVFDGRGW